MSAHNKLQLFAGSYTPADLPGIHAFDFDPSAGLLRRNGSFSGVNNPSFLVVHPNGRWLFAVSEMGMAPDGRHGAVHAIDIRYGDAGVDLTPIGRISTGGDWPCHLAIDASGRWIAASNYGTGDAAVFPILPDGALGEMSAFVRHEGRGPNQARQEGPHAHSATFTPDNRFVIIADLGIDRLVVYRFDPDNGSLQSHVEVPAQPGAGPRHLAFHPSGRHVLAANELDSSVSVYEYDAENGALHLLQTLKTLPDDAPENTVADIHFSPSGEYVYVSNRGHNSIALFRYDSNGHLSRLAVLPCGGNWPRNFALSPDGHFMLVANRYSGDICVMPVLSGGSELGPPVQRTAVDQPSCVVFPGTVPG